MHQNTHRPTIPKYGHPFALMEAQPAGGCVPIRFGSLRSKKGALSVAARHFYDFLMKSDHSTHMNINVHIPKRQSVSCGR